MRKYLNIFLMIFAVSITGLAVTGCNDDGPVENAGESMDNAVEETKEAFDPDGPAENAGEEIDETFDGDDS